MKNKIKVMGFGTFDGLHPGHRFFLGELKKLGDEVIVIVARDVNVERFKGRPPAHNENDRLLAVQNEYLGYKVMLGETKNFYKCIRDHKPHVIGLGYDQKADTDYLNREFPEIKITRLPAHAPDKYKSSLLRG
ncbi:adenylyltransferase/cytidyltransferase family protein [Candidatus Peregrinibacteria bacterium]|nr:adenylyltransferase/cytidyltransferase family protein [Candidatus Peregrinibacteria bacterium]